MPTVEFHILSEAGDIARHRYACQLVEALYLKGERTLIRTGDSNTAQRMDDMLWTFRDQAFIPHEIATEASPSHPRIMALIATEPLPSSFASSLINIGDTIPGDLSSLTHIVEVVDADPQHKQLARERYKQYRERGFQLETKNL